MNQSLKVCVFIFARGGSKGVPGKNIKLLGGKPLIAHSIELAKKCPSVSRVIVSTDSEEIASVARAHGAEVPFLRPKNLADDNSPEWLAWQHAVLEINKDYAFDYFVSLPTTSPFRAVEDVEKALEMIHRHDDVDFILSLPVSLKEIHGSTWLKLMNKVTQKLLISLKEKFPADRMLLKPGTLPLYYM
jgi:CMP-N-acetylneuraminic acid synthetase